MRVIVPNFDLLRERKIVNSKEAIRFEIEALSHKIASTKRMGSYDIWQEDLPRTTTRKLKRFQIEKQVRELKESGGGEADTRHGKTADRRRAAWLQSRRRDSARWPSRKNRRAISSPQFVRATISNSTWDSTPCSGSNC